MTGRSTLILVLGVMGYAAAQVLGSVEIPVTVAIEPAYEVTPEPVTLDHGRIALGIPAILSTVHIGAGNAEASLWCSVIDGPGGWTLGPEAGPDTYAIVVDGVAMTGEPQQIYPWVAPYEQPAVSFRYYAPTSDSFGAGKDQGYRMRIEARPATIPAPPEPADGRVD